VFTNVATVGPSAGRQLASRGRTPPNHVEQHRHRRRARLPHSTINALLAGSPTAPGDRLSMLDYLARRQRAQISGMTDLRDK
jgi:hypothetical protein